MTNCANSANFAAASENMRPEPEAEPAPAVAMPGPWSVDANGPDWFNIIESHGFTVAEAIRDRATARLVAAAPDVTSALKSLVNDVTGAWSIAPEGIRAAIGNTNYQVVLDKLAEAEAALAKASK